MVSSRMAAVIAAIAVLMTLSAGIARAGTKLLADAYLPKQHPLMAGLLILQQDLNRVTHGDVTLDLSGSALSPSNRQYDSVVNGIVDVAIAYIGWQREQLVLPQVAEIPFTTSSGEKASAASWETYEKFFASAGEYKDVKLLGFLVHPGNAIYTREKEIHSIADFKGMKLRAGAGVAAELVGMLGGTVVTSSGGEIFDYISKGIVDGIVTSDDSINSFGIAKYVKFGLQAPNSFGSDVWSIVMNRAKWDGLSSDDRLAINDVIGEKLSGAAGRAYDQSKDRSLETSKAAGVHIGVANGKLLQDIRTALQPARARWIDMASQKRHIDGTAALKYYLAQQGLAD